MKVVVVAEFSSGRQRDSVAFVAQASARTVLLFLAEIGSVIVYGMRGILISIDPAFPVRRCDRGRTVRVVHFVVDCSRDRGVMADLSGTRKAIGMAR